ncbi:hypothetical protein D0T92_01150 [Neisseria zalophi]|uniref:Uncharacterized protein n=1 Tax=Neisseria zalophi TaxID=640030 RepID=A0A5J6PRH5_9NEIS|nr:hypothetical protein D0T92_01150 [Neisseria zalophi]
MFVVVQLFFIGWCRLINGFNSVGRPFEMFQTACPVDVEIGYNLTFQFTVRAPSFIKETL